MKRKYGLRCTFTTAKISCKESALKSQICGKNSLWQLVTLSGWQDIEYTSSECVKCLQSRSAATHTTHTTVTGSDWLNKDALAIELRPK